MALQDFSKWLTSKVYGDLDPIAMKLLAIMQRYNKERIQAKMLPGKGRDIGGFSHGKRYNIQVIAQRLRGLTWKEHGNLARNLIREIEISLDENPRKIADKFLNIIVLADQAHDDPNYIKDFEDDFRDWAKLPGI